jgi:hypothetical protein
MRDLAPHAALSTAACGVFHLTDAAADGPPRVHTGGFFFLRRDSFGQRRQYFFKPLFESGYCKLQIVPPLRQCSGKDRISEIGAIGDPRTLLFCCDIGRKDFDDTI